MHTLIRIHKLLTIRMVILGEVLLTYFMYPIQLHRSILYMYVMLTEVLLSIPTQGIKSMTRVTTAAFLVLR